MVFGVPVKTGWRRTRENPVPALLLKQAGWHGRARRNHRRIQHPALGPTRLEALFSQGEIRRRGLRIPLRITRGVALQAWRSLACEQLPRHVTFLVGERL